MNKRILLSIFCLTLTITCAKKKEPKCDYTGPADHAFDKAGPVDGGFILPNGVKVTPTGIQIQVGQFPMNLIEVPSKNILIVTNNGKHDQSLSVIDTMTNQTKQKIKIPNPSTDYSFFIGLAISPDASKLYVSGGAENKIFVFHIDASGNLSLNDQISISSFPSGLAISSDGKYLYAALMLANSLGIIDLSQIPPVVNKVTVGSMTEQLPFPYPFWVTLSKDEKKAYISNWGDMSVSVVDIQQKLERTRIPVGKNPEGMVLSPDGNKLYVANSDTDNITVIDASTDSVIGTYSVNFDSDAPLGASPTTLDITSDGNFLFVSSAGTNSVDIISTENMTVTGRIPVGWYPVRVLLSKDETKLYVLNAKGLSGLPNPKLPDVGDIMTGYLSIIPKHEIFLNPEFYTNKVIENNNRLSTYYELPCKNLNSPIPAEPGGNSPIKHVVFIVKENKTYDQVLGDLEGTEADPSLVEFGEEYTPNTHKLAREFANLDNCYSDAEVSLQGHMWVTASYSNDFVERGWLMDIKVTGAGVEPAGHPGNKFFFHHLLENNINFMVYGEAVGVISELWGLFGKEQIFKGYVDENWPGGVIWSMVPKDEERAKYFRDRLKEWEESGDMPQYIMMLLPNDHTYGVSPGKPTPESMVSDNDYALGLVVEALTHSRFWKETVIFVTEDDPQSGGDHIEGHRTICLVISPYVKRGYTSHVHYSVPSIFKTMELILGIQPMYQYDERAPAMYDVFTTEPDFTPYDAIPPQVPYKILSNYEELSPEMKVLADMTKKMDFSEPDSPKNHALGYVIKRYLELTKFKKNQE